MPAKNKPRPAAAMAHKGTSSASVAVSSAPDTPKTRKKPTAAVMPLAALINFEFIVRSNVCL